MNISMVNILLNLDLNYNTQKNYQKFYYSTTPMKSTFKMSLQNNKKGRSFYQPQREENVAKSELDPEKIRNSFT